MTSARAASCLSPLILAALAVAATGGGPAAGAATPPPAAPAAEAADLAAARAVFRRNIEAIQRRDAKAYLDCYLDSERLVRSGPAGFELGYKDFAAGIGQGWPDHLEAEEMRLTSLQPGIVYGTYRYRVRYGADEQAGISERLFVATPGGWRIAMTTAFPADATVPPPPIALAGATLVDGSGGAPVADSVVLLKDGKIACAGPRAACPVPAGTEQLDVHGLWVTPGLIDAHVHFSQTGWADGRPDSLDVRSQHAYPETIAELNRHPERFGRTDLCAGVTSVFDVGGYPWTLQLSAWAATRNDVPNIAAAGPLLSTVDHWLGLPAERQFIFLKDAEAATTGVAYLAARGSQAVKVWYIVRSGHNAQEYAPLVLAAGEEARRLKLPLIVHATGLAEAKIALRAGARLLVHSVGDLPVDDEFLELARRNGTIYCPTLIVTDGYVQMYAAALANQAPAIDDPNGCVDPETRARIAETASWGKLVTKEQVEVGKKRRAALVAVQNTNLMRVAAAGIPIAMGTDAGNPLTLHGTSVYAEMEAMQAAGMPAAQVLVTATHGGALAMGKDIEIGTVASGKVADLLVVGADPTTDIAHLRQVRFVVRGGVVRSLAELKGLATAPLNPPAAAK